VQETLCTRYAGDKVILDHDDHIYTLSENGELNIYKQDGSLEDTLKPSDTKPSSSNTSIARTKDDRSYYAVDRNLYEVDFSGNPKLNLITSTRSPIRTLIGLEEVLLVQTQHGIWRLLNNELIESEIEIKPNSIIYFYNLGHNHLLLNNMDGWWHILGFEDLKNTVNKDRQLRIIDRIKAQGELISGSYASTRDTLLIGKIQGLTRLVKNKSGDWRELDSPVVGMRIVDIDFKKGRPTWLLSDQGLVVGNGLNWQYIKEEQGMSLHTI